MPLAPIPEVLNGEDHFAYVQGYSDGTVQPEGNITRAETATMLYRLLKEVWREIIFTDQNSFSDMDKSIWYNKAVSSMANGEYVTGYPDGTFQGDNSITREEFVTIMVRFLEQKLADPSDRKQVKKASDALARRGFSWNEVSEGIRRARDRARDR